MGRCGSPQQDSPWRIRILGTDLPLCTTPTFSQVWMGWPAKKRIGHLLVHYIGRRPEAGTVFRIMGQPFIQVELWHGCKTVRLHRFPSFTQSTDRPSIRDTGGSRRRTEGRDVAARGVNAARNCRTMKTW